MKDQLKARSIIKKLNGKTKFNMSKNSQSLGFSRQQFQYHLDKLIEEKIIKNFTININPKLNLKYVILEIKTNPKEPQLVEELLKIPQLKMLDGVLGEFSLIALFIFRSSEEYYQVLNNIDRIMAKSYFKKYQIIETIRIFKTNGIELSDLDNDFKIDLDEIDYLILEILQRKQENKPISTYDIKHMLQKDFKKDVSQPTVHHRIKILENYKVILNYGVNFNPKGLGFNGKYIVRIKPKDPSKYDELALRLEKNHNITDLFRVGEQYGLLAIVRVENVVDYGIFIKVLYEKEEIEDTFTNFVLDERIAYTNFRIY